MADASPWTACRRFSNSSVWEERKQLQLSFSSKPTQTDDNATTLVMAAIIDMLHKEVSWAFLAYFSEQLQIQETYFKQLYVYH